MSIQKRMFVLSTFMVFVVCGSGTVCFYYSYSCLPDFVRTGGKEVGGEVYGLIVLLGFSMPIAAIFLLYALHAIGRDLQRGTQSVDHAILAIRTAFEDRGCCPGAATLSPNEGIDHLTLSLKGVMQDIQKQIVQTGFEEFREILRNIHACLSIHTEKIAFIGAGVKNTSNQLLRQEAIWSGLLDISGSITSGPEFQDAVQRVVETLQNLTQSYGIIVMTLHEERQLVTLVFSGYAAGRKYDIDTLRITLDDPSLSARAVRTRAIQWAYSVEEDEEYLKIDDRVRTEVIIPLYHGEHALGAMVVSFDKRCRRNEGFLSMLAPLSAYLSAYLEVWRIQTELRSSYEYLVRKFQQIADIYNHETAEHLERVSRCSGMAASWLGCSPQEQRDIVVFSRTHDLGKIRVPSEILLKPCGLTPDEYEIVKRHTIWGAELIGDAEWLSIARNICLTHHEHWNGTGYPYGLRGREIPLEGRIVALMDVYDALRSERPYKRPCPHEEAVTIILEGDGRVMPEHFDPDILAFFRQNHREMERVYDETSLL